MSIWLLPSAEWMTVMILVRGAESLRQRAHGSRLCRCRLRKTIRRLFIWHPLYVLIHMTQ